MARGEISRYGLEPSDPVSALLRKTVPKLWRENPELLWPYLLRSVVVPFIDTCLAPGFVYGRDRVPLAGGGILAANHLSAVDPAVIGGLCPRTIYYMAKVELLAMPVVGEALQWTGAFPVRRGEGDREALRRARELVRAGHLVGIFLEGTRQRFGYPGPPQPGGLMIAMQEAAPVIPCGVYSFGWTRKNRMRCAVVFGEPISLAGFPRTGAGYREAARTVSEEVWRLWRLAGEAVAADFPAELPGIGAHAGIYPPFRRTGPR